MSNLYLMTTVVDRKIAKRYLNMYQENGQQVLFLAFGTGTASSEILDYLGLEHAEKTVVFSIVEEATWFSTKKQLQKKLRIDVPGGGIAFIIPLSSIGGRKALNYLLAKDDYQKEEESTLKDTAHELIVVIANQGNSELVMDAARSAGAYGGTIIHAKGTGKEAAEKFMGVSLAAEKEMLFIVTKTNEKNAIMKAIMEKAGLNSKAKSICFSLPVSDTAGLRLLED